MTTVDLLENTYDKIAEIAHWTRDEFARTAEGGICEPNDPHATCWCLFGALRAVFGVDSSLAVALLPEPFPTAAMCLSAAIGGWRSVVGFNDAHTHDEVLAALARAIEIARGGAC